MEEEIDNVTFAKMAEEWLQFKKTQIKESTYLNYNYIVNKRLVPQIGKLNIKQIQLYNFNGLIGILMERLSNKTVRDAIVVLKGILKFSEIKYDKDFKLELIATPKIAKKEVQIFKESETRKIKDYCLKNKNPRTIGILICTYTGLRIGELCALKWEDFNVEKRTIDVTHTMQRVYKGKKDTAVIYTTPKTQKSIRRIPISHTLWGMLKKEINSFDKEAYVLTGEREKYMEPMCLRNYYKQLLKNCDISYRKFHCLRHTFATKCIKVGMDVKSLSEILGHSNVSITLNIYVHSSIETKEYYIDKL